LVLEDFLKGLCSGTCQNQTQYTDYVHKDMSALA
jgi:hypothetical protein